MANLTIALDDDILHRARVRAAEQGTSINSLLRSYLESYAGDRQARARNAAAFLDLARQNPGSRGTRSWTRDELHERNG